MIKEEITVLSNKVNLKINKDFYKKNNHNNDIFLAYLYNFLLKHKIYKLFTNINKTHNIKFLHNSATKSLNENFIIKFKKNTKKVNTKFELNFSIPKNHFYNQIIVIKDMYYCTNSTNSTKSTNSANNLLTLLPKDIFDIICEYIESEPDIEIMDSKLEKIHKIHKNRDKFKNIKLNKENKILKQKTIKKFNKKITKV